MGATKRKSTKPRHATLAPVTPLFPALADLVSVEMLRAGLADLVPGTIELLQQHQGETFAERWWSCARLSQMILQTLPVVEDCLHSGQLRRGTEEQVLLAPPVLAFPLAALAFAPGGVRIADLHWEARHPMAAAAIPLRITEDGSSAGWDKPIGQATVTRLKLWLPLLMAANAALSQEEMAIELAEVGSFDSDDALFSEALVVGGSDRQMGEAFIQLARTLAVMAFVPGGITLMGYRWEARPRNAPWPAETPASGEESQP